MRELEFKTQKSFADALKLQPGTLSDIFREKPGVGVSSNTKRILENSYNVNIHWLETGDGEPTIISKSGSNSDINNIETPTIDISEQDTSSPKEKSYVTERKLYPLVPMYNFPASASVIEMYNDPNDIKVVGHLSIPGSTKKSFALPVYGHSMYPTLENGAWCVLRPIENANDILWGEIYYIEWGDYRNFKRLLASENEEDVILWSDNQSEVVNGRPKYSPVTIKKESIRKLCLLTDILKKPNY
ncbi:Phage repressor protein C, contains Cro/C1-type HTH and peptisase s24 domains [Pedobacter africanus]|uniref:Phage repressor protein C, contains Cro/C1-type HTH and peptisase s24 domains n=2 Tax=Pedobacter africanus TaxID=151894 RepID=A0A1W1ZCX6_9SPHI|nr:Phage repressor protein C, contains Cro/C1-type HTH and peptisase s24 domains [Pedobacter africanus]